MRGAREACLLGTASFQGIPSYFRHGGTVSGHCPGSVACSRKMSVWSLGDASTARLAYRPPPMLNHVEFSQFADPSWMPSSYFHLIVESVHGPLVPVPDSLLNTHRSNSPTWNLGR